MKKKCLRISFRNFIQILLSGKFISARLIFYTYFCFQAVLNPLNPVQILNIGAEEEKSEIARLVRMFSLFILLFLILYILMVK